MFRSFVPLLALLVALSLKGGLVAASPAEPGAAPAYTREVLCDLIESAAHERGLPADFFTRLIWQESSFRITAVSPKGAQGIAQFMPATAAERGLADPFDPVEAIPASADLLRELSGSFGNLGLAAAAYNAGPRRVSDWLTARGSLPGETRHYVAVVTGRDAEDWRTSAADAHVATESVSCLRTVAALGQVRPQARVVAGSLWGKRAEQFARYSAIARSSALTGSILRRVGTSVRPAASPAQGRSHSQRLTAANGNLCAQLREAGGACASARR